MHPQRFSIQWTLAAVAAMAAAVLIYVAIERDWIPKTSPVLVEERSGVNRDVKPVSYTQAQGLSFRGGVDWINSGPITLNELRGKIVLLDFWTYCCINCHHVLPDLAKLEEKYKNELVVIGVHSGKFAAERDTENIRSKVREYRIKHPVVNDAKMAIWNRFGVNSWPTLVLLDANGEYQGSISGEGHYDALDRVIGRLVEAHKAKGDLNLTPLKFSPEMERPSTGPLLFPGKVLADSTGKRLFIADTGHNRIIQTGLDGGKAVVIGGGEEGFNDGDYSKARFNRPQGMCLEGETLYIADTENHAIRAVDLKEAQVTTIAGIGTQARSMSGPGASGPARTTPLVSPWDVIQIPGDRSLYIAMAGPHQIWKIDPSRETISVFAGSGTENIKDGTSATANFAQPSGLATDGENLFIADSEVSGVRVITGIHEQVPMVRTIVGVGLFDFGDRDGRGPVVRLQHCLGLSYADGHLYIADTYNNKVKVCEPKNRSVRALVGSHIPGDSDNPPRFYQPGGLSAADSRLFVADTNNHKIKVVDLKTDVVKTLAFDGLSPPRLAPQPPTFPNATLIHVPAVQASPGKSISLAVTVPVGKGYKLNEAAPLVYLVETPDKTDILAAEVPRDGQRVKPPVPQFNVTVPLAKEAVAGDALEVRFSLQTFVCKEASNLCQIKNFVWNVPITISATGGSEPIILKTELK